jgi:pantoate--beta-alanine ligase
MGFLHEGHVSLIEAARRESDSVVVSLFVNPLQFGDRADLERYPRDLDRDSEIVSAAGADLLFAPPLEEVYPASAVTKVTLPEITARMEGAMRPGHFDGVALVVTKLLAGVQPDLAFFGRKDAQQLVMVRRMAADLGFPVAIRDLPIVREADGLALSSRNVRLSPNDRARALGLSRALMAVADAIDSGERSGVALESLARTDSGLVLDYAELSSAQDAARVEHLTGPGFLAVAAGVGGVRLIDNLAIDWVEGSPRPDRGVRLGGPSILYRER